MSDISESDKHTEKKTTSRIKAVTQKIALAEEKLEEAISHEIDAVEKGAKKVDQALTSFSRKHGVLTGLFWFGAFCVILWLLAQYYE